jgi:hypothetical protein
MIVGDEPEDGKSFEPPKGEKLKLPENSRVGLERRLRLRRNSINFCTKMFPLSGKLKAFTPRQSRSNVSSRNDFEESNLGALPQLLCYERKQGRKKASISS